MLNLTRSHTGGNFFSSYLSAAPSGGLACKPFNVPGTLEISAARFVSSFAVAQTRTSKLGEAAEYNACQQLCL